MSLNPDVDFEVIVVGAGIAGAVTAHQLATKGRNVLLVERGATAGSKNLSGGVFYCRVMDQVFPGFANAAPVERHIVRNCVSFHFVGNKDQGDMSTRPAKKVRRRRLPVADVEGEERLLPSAGGNLKLKFSESTAVRNKLD